MSDAPGPDSDDAPPALLGGPALRADGTVEGRPRSHPHAEAPRPLAPAREEPLELDRRPPYPTSDAPTAYRPDPNPPRRWLPYALGGAVLTGLAIALAAMVVTPASPARVPELPLPAPLRDALPQLAGPPVIITSEPAGATIRSAAGVIGTTPWAGNNPFLIDTELTLSLSGHQPRVIMLRGASEATIAVTLKRTAR
ncbi:MAG: hypothetical protein IAE78_27275 [Myxococcus sp.]|nr:hypothetical protein [Myxococcus sp.]